MRKRKLLFCLLLFCLLFSPLFAGGGGGGGGGELAFEEYHLNNGCTIILKYLPGSRLCSINLLVKAGSFVENENSSGISHFFEHIFFRSMGSFKQELDFLGAAANGETNRDFTRFYLTLPAENALAGVKLLSQAFLNPELPEKELLLEKRIVLKEMQLYQEQPVAKMRDTLYQLAFPLHPYRFPVIGRVENIRSFTAQDLYNFKNRFYSADKMIWIISGNFPRQEVFNLLNSRLADLSPRGEYSVPAQEPEAALYSLKVKELDTYYPFWGLTLGFWAPPAREHASVLAMDVLAFHLGKGEDAFLKKKLKIPLEVIYLTQREGGLLEIYLPRLKEKEVKTYKQQVFEQLSQIAESGISTRELKRAKQLLKLDYLSQLSTADGIAGTLGFYACLDKAGFAASYLDNIEKLSLQDLKETAKQMLAQPYYTVVLKGRKDED